MNTITDHERLRLAKRSLDGLSIGDAFGERFFAAPAIVERMIEDRALPEPPWRFTDDTVMALSIIDTLEDLGTIDCDRLADYFGVRYRLDPGRGYGGTAHGILNKIASGTDWEGAAGDVFDGQGSMGNGGAMRAAPVGAYFFDDYERTAREADHSANVTHAHPEGRAGAIAVAIATAWAARNAEDVTEMFRTVLAHTPGGATTAGIQRAAELPLTYDVRTAVSALGNGTRIISEDTVPFSLWCAARHINDYESALWTTVSGLGDRDTTCAIVGGILAARESVQIPDHWCGNREDLGCMCRTLLPSRRQRRAGV
jgi:ADP-ribosylglycohydrolase